jgi:hypothetical protein
MRIQCKLAQVVGFIVIFVKMGKFKSISLSFATCEMPVDKDRNNRFPVSLRYNTKVSIDFGNVSPMPDAAVPLDVSSSRPLKYTFNPIDWDVSLSEPFSKVGCELHGVTPYPNIILQDVC